MSSVKKFKSKSESMKGEVDNLSSSKLKEELCTIPEEFKGHYSGVCGECNYDTRMFEECEVWLCRCLHYKEDSGIPPVIPEGYTDCRYMFWDCSDLTTLDVSHLDTTHITNMDCMFGGCGSLTALDLSNFDTSSVTDMSYMFWNCSDLTTLDISNFNTARVTDMSYMFKGCRGLTSLDLSNFDMSNVKYMKGMFLYCGSLKTVDLPNFDILKVEHMEGLFEYCDGLTKECRIKLKAHGFDL